MGSRLDKVKEALREQLIEYQKEYSDIKNQCNKINEEITKHIGWWEDEGFDKIRENLLDKESVLKVFENALYECEKDDRSKIVENKLFNQRQELIEKEKKIFDKLKTMDFIFDKIDEMGEGCFNR